MFRCTVSALKTAKSETCAGTRGYPYRIPSEREQMRPGATEPLKISQGSSYCGSLTANSPIACGGEEDGSATCMRFLSHVPIGDCCTCTTNQQLTFVWFARPYRKGDYWDGLATQTNSWKQLQPQYNTVHRCMSCVMPLKSCVYIQGLGEGERSALRCSPCKYLLALCRFKCTQSQSEWIRHIYNLSNYKAM